MSWVVRLGLVRLGVLLTAAAVAYLIYQGYSLVFGRGPL